MKAYYKYKNWYKLIYDKLRQDFKDDYIILAGLIASTSPRFQIKRNINTSLNIYNDYKNNRIDFLNNAINNKDLFIKHYKLIGKAHYNNVLKVLKHNSGDLELGGDKVNSFYHNIIGDYNYVTLDIWMLRHFKIKKRQFRGADYKKYTSIIRGLSKRYKLHPAELQAILWVKVRQEAGFKDKHFIDFL
jgi:hypothetical protein